MRKNDLINMLTQLEGNPEIMLWNGLVGDFVPVGKLGHSDLVKMQFEYYCKMVELEYRRDRNDNTYTLTDDDITELKSCYKQHHKWEVNSFVDSEDIKRKAYKSKRIAYIDAKITGKTSYDRLGSISY